MQFFLESKWLFGFIWSVLQFSCLLTKCISCISLSGDPCSLNFQFLLFCTFVFEPSVKINIHSEYIFHAFLMVTLPCLLTLSNVCRTQNFLKLLMMQLISMWSFKRIDMFTGTYLKKFFNSYRFFFFFTFSCFVRTAMNVQT